MSEVHKMSSAVQIIGALAEAVYPFTRRKAFGKIGWSWWLVFAPMWLPPLIIATGFALIIGALTGELR